MKQLMKLVYACNNEPVVIGDVVHVRNEQYYIQGIVPPHKPSSTGRVWCTTKLGSGRIIEWFPSVVGAHWITLKVNGK